jgi:hypothetical protein
VTSTEIRRDSYNMVSFFWLKNGHHMLLLLLIIISNPINNNHVVALDGFRVSQFCSHGVVGGEESETVGRGQGRVVRLQGQGQHRILAYHFQLKNPRPGRETVDVAIVHSLPTVWFVDPFEAKRVVGQNQSVFESHVLGPVDLESIEMYTKSISHALVVQNASLDQDGVPVDVGIRIHARYASVPEDAGLQKNVLEWLLSDKVRVAFDPFEIYIRSSTGHCTRIVPVQEPLSTEVPAGAERHTQTVVLLTALSITFGFLFTISGFIQKSLVG